MHAFKYQQRLEQVKFFSGAIRGRISKLGDIDLIIPVPMHRRKLRSRGYNQAALLAQLLGEQTGSRVLVSALRRVRNDKAQMELDRKERLRNVRSAFAISNKIEKLLKGRSVLLIDDVVTTGATINECARVLKKSGASKVQATTVARTLG